MTSDEAHDIGRERHGRYYCRKCADEGIVESARERYSLGIYAMVACDQHWDESGYRKEGFEGFDRDDCGESYEDDYLNV